MKRIVITFLLCFGIACAFLIYVKWEDSNEKKLPKADKVVVYKSKRLMNLYKDGELIRSYTIALGNTPLGHKVKEGDERTPEGKYLLDWRNSKSTCYKSIHISYPNKADKKRAKDRNVSPGGNIMIHGLHSSVKWMGKYHYMKDWTDGCVAVSNEEMDEIWSSVRYGTPIEIRK